MESSDCMLRDEPAPDVSGQIPGVVEYLDGIRTTAFSNAWLYGRPHLT